MVQFNAPACERKLVKQKALQDSERIKPEIQPQGLKRTEAVSIGKTSNQDHLNHEISRSRLIYINSLEYSQHLMFIATFCACFEALLI